LRPVVVSVPIVISLGTLSVSVFPF
jgi:hypothetical protein